MGTKMKLIDKIDRSLKELDELSDENLIESVYSQENIDDFSEYFENATKKGQQKIRHVLEQIDSDYQKDQISQEQFQESLRAGVITFLAAKEPEKYRRRANELHNDGNVDIVSLFSGSGGTVDVLDESKFSLESFDAEQISEYLNHSILYNTLACRQNEFAESFFPTQVLAPSQGGISITLSQQLVYTHEGDYPSHDPSGNTNAFKVNNLVDGLRNPNLLANATTELIPYPGEEGSDRDQKFVSREFVDNRMQPFATGEYLTRPLAIDQSINLLAISQRDDHVDSKQFDLNDHIARGARLSKVYIGFEYEGQKIATEHNVEYMPTNEFKPAHEQNDSIYELNFRSETFIVDKNTKFIGTPYQAIRDKIIATDLTVFLSVHLYGNLDVKEGDIEVHSSSVNIEKMVNRNGRILDPETDGEYQQVKDSLESMGMRVIGYDLRARRTNENLRSIGTIIETGSRTESYAIEPGYPISAMVPDEQEINSAKIAGMINASRVRNSNVAVTTLLNYRDQLRHYQTALEQGQIVDIVGAARAAVQPYYTYQKFDVQKEIFVLSNHELYKAASRVIVDAVRTVAYRLYKESDYASALEILSPNPKDRPCVLIGCDPYVKRYLNIEGQLGGLLGEHLDYKVVSTADERMNNRIFISFTNHRPGSENGLTFGVHGYVPEFIEKAFQEQNGANFWTYQVIPRSTHVPVLPILGEIELEGLDEFSRVEVPEFDDDVLESIFDAIDTAKKDAKSYTDTEIDKAIDNEIYDMVSSSEKRSKDYTDEQIKKLREDELDQSLEDLEKSLKEYADKQANEAESDARRYTNDQIEKHSDKSTNVHGVPDGEIVEWKSSAQQKADTAEQNAQTYTDERLDENLSNSKEYTDQQIDEHASQVNDVHGVPEGEAVEWHSSAQAKADKAESNAKDYTSSKLDSHTSDDDPHPQYQKTSEKGRANGYAPLNEDGYIPSAHLSFDTDFDDRYVRREQDLSDLSSIDQARANLGVYSIDEIDTLLSNRADWNQAYRQSVVSINADGNGVLTIERRSSSEEDLTADLSHTHDFEDLPISAADANHWDQAYDKSIEELRLSSSDEKISIELTRIDGSILTDEVSLNNENWDVAFNRSIVGIEGSARGSLTLVREDGSVLTTDLEHNHDEDYILRDDKGVAGGVAPLNAEGKISSTYLPSFDINETYVVADIDERDQLDASNGDVAIVEDASDDPDVEDGSENYMFVDGEWKPLGLPTDVVRSINGQRGNVSLNYEDVGADEKGSASRAESNAKSHAESYARNEVGNHAALTSGTHGLSDDERFESEQGAQSKADVAETNAKNYADDAAREAVRDHENESDPHSQYLHADQRGAPGGVVPLNDDEQIPDQYLPNIEDTEVFIVDDIEERDQLEPSVLGSVAVVLDASDDPDVDFGRVSYIWDDEGWILLSDRHESVRSINGQTGDIELDYDDVGAERQGRAGELIDGHIVQDDPHPQYIKTEKIGASGGVVPLNDDGSIDSSYLPEINAIEVFTFANITERDNHDARRGHVAIVSDASLDPDVTSGSASYIYDGDRWNKLKKPDDTVTSINGQTGDVELDYTDLGAEAEGKARQAYEDAQTYTDEQISDHASEQTNVHGIGPDEQFESTSGAQSKADSARQGAITESKEYTDQRIDSHLDASDPHTQYLLRSEGNEPDGFARLNSEGMLSQSLIPAIEVSDTYVVDDIAERDGLDAGKGDVAIVMDASDDPDISSGSATYINDGEQWKRFQQPDNVVYSVNGMSGDVKINYVDVGADQKGSADQALDAAKEHTADRINQHADRDSGIHGLDADESFESTKGAQQKADQAKSESVNYTDSQLDKKLTDHVGKDDPHSQYQLKSEKGQPGGYASLGADGKVKEAQLPTFTTGDVYTFEDIAERDERDDYNKGDIALISDASLDSEVDSGPASYIHDGDKWRRFKRPDESVTSVNARTGDVSLDYEDVGADPAGAANDALSQAQSFTEDRVDTHADKSGDTHGLGENETFESEQGAQAKADAAQSAAKEHADSNLSDHESRTTGVHGLKEGEYFETTAGARKKVEEHAERETGIHGIPDGEQIEWQSSAQQKADSAESSANTYTDDQVSKHRDRVDRVHGVPEGEEVEWKSSAQQKADRAKSDAVSESNSYTDNQIDEHSGKTGGVHGLSDDEQVESTDGAQSKADSAESSAKSYTDDHADKTGGTHGLSEDETFASTDYVDQLAYETEQSAKEYTDQQITNHAELEGDVHGVPNGERIEWKSSAQEKANIAQSNAISQSNDYTDTQISEHESKTGGVHGIDEDDYIESVSGSTSKSNAAEIRAKQYTDSHEQKESGVHGIPEGEYFETTSGAQQKADTAESNAKAYVDDIIEDAVIADIDEQLQQGKIRQPKIDSFDQVTDERVPINVEVYGSSYNSLYSNDKRTYRRFQAYELGDGLIENPDLHEIDWDESVVDVTRNSDSEVLELDFDKTYAVRILDYNERDILSRWSEPAVITTATLQPARPILDSPSDGEEYVFETPRFEAGEFRLLNADGEESDDYEHIDTEILIERVSDDKEIYRKRLSDQHQDLSDRDLTYFDIERGIIQDGETTYRWYMRYRDKTYGWTPLSEPHEFTTVSNFTHLYVSTSDNRLFRLRSETLETTTSVSFSDTIRSITHHPTYGLFVADEKYIYKLDEITLEQQRVSSEFNDRILDIHIDDQGRLFASDNDERVFRLSPDTLSILATGSAWRVRFELTSNDDGYLIACGNRTGSGGGFTLYDPSTLEEISMNYSDPDQTSYSIASSGGRAFGYTSDGRIRKIDPQSLNLLETSPEWYDSGERKGMIYVPESLDYIVIAADWGTVYKLDDRSLEELDRHDLNDGNTPVGVINENGLTYIADQAGIVSVIDSVDFSFVDSVSLSGDCVVMFKQYS